MSDASLTNNPVHGAAALPLVTVDSYNVELRDDEGFVGDHANKRAFQSILEDWRDRLRRVGGDPLGAEVTGRIDRRELASILTRGDVEAAGLVLTAVEDFAQELADVCRCLLGLPEWQDTERIVVGGGFRDSRIGELAIGRAGVLLKADGRHIVLQPIRHHPEKAGLLGAVHLVPREKLRGCDAMLGADIGGTNVRVGLVVFDADDARDLSTARVETSEVWRYVEEKPDRDTVVARLIAMLGQMIGKAAETGRRLAPLIGVGCPGVIRADGTIERGAQNLPGDWEDPSFNLPDLLRTQLRPIAGTPPRVLLHNDAVVQGLSELPWMQDVSRWGILTIGTGLGNARFTNRSRG